MDCAKKQGNIIVVGADKLGSCDFIFKGGFIMAFDRRPIYFDGIDGIFDEKGSTFCTMRKVQWVKEGEEPDKEKAKFELRKYRIGSEGEIPDKGFSFLTEDGPNELVNILIDQGFGNTKEVLRKLKKRKDFKESVKTLFEDAPVDDPDGEYFDMRSVLLDESEESEGE